MKRLNTGDIPFTHEHIIFNQQNEARNALIREEQARLQQILDLFSADLITIEQVMVGFESFAAEGCISILEMEDKIRALILPLFTEKSQYLKVMLSRRLHNTVIIWYRDRCTKNIENAEQDLNNYLTMIGEIPLAELEV